MKRRINFINFLSIFLIFAFSLSFIISVVLFASEQGITDLILAIVSGICLVIYALFLLIRKSAKNYLFVYDNFYPVNGVNIIKKATLKNSKKTNKYKKYGLDSLIEENHIYADRKKRFSFKLVKIDEDRKVMIIKNKYLDKYFSSSYEMDYELMLKHYYSNHEIIPYSSDAIVKDNRNIGVINEINGKFVVSMYRHNVPIGISSLKEIDKHNVSWQYNGSSNDEGIEYFYSYEEAREYILNY